MADSGTFKTSST